MLMVAQWCPQVGGGGNPPLVRSIAPHNFFTEPKNKKAIIFQNDLNFGVSVSITNTIFSNRGNINFFCVINKDFLFRLHRFFTNLEKLLHWGSFSEWVIMHFNFLRMCQTCTKHNKSMENYSTFFPLDLNWPKMCRQWPKLCKKSDLKYYDLKWNFELGGLLRLLKEGIF